MANPDDETLAARDAKVKALPQRSGVYLMKDRRGKVLYIGKALHLRSRVSSYFQPSRTPHPRTDALVKQVRDVDVLVTDSELEALILEQSMIKEYSPRYNVNLKDDKRFPYVQITTGHPYPAIFITRKLGDKSSRYFGPYVDVGSLRQTVKRLRRAFPLRVCSDRRVDQTDTRECLDYFIGSCSAPCTRRVNEPSYDEIVRSLISFLNGNGDRVLDALEADMRTASEAKEYERAAVFRDRIRAARSVLQRQKVETPGGEDADVFGLATDEDDALVTVLRVRDGRMIGKEDRRMSKTGTLTEPAILGEFLMQHYLSVDSHAIPKRLELPFDVSESDLMHGWLERRCGRKVRCHVPQRGKLAGLVRVATENARLALEEDRVKKRADGRAAPVLYELKDALQLKRVPMRIEGVDISNIQGTDTVASVVVFVGGTPDRNLYRHYKIRTVEGSDDFASMHEVVERRVARAVDEDSALPDLFLIDGGEGQLNAAMRVLEKYDLHERVHAVGLAKKDERVVFADGRSPLHLSRRSPSLKLLQRVRDESHRFALRYHRKLRGRRLTASALDDVPGIGPGRKAQLLRAFGSVEAIRAADEHDLAALPGIGTRIAREVMAALRENLDAAGETKDADGTDNPEGKEATG
jgi:excinuclease ABC subunit C